MPKTKLVAVRIRRGLILITTPEQTKIYSHPDLYHHEGKKVLIDEHLNVRRRGKKICTAILMLQKPRAATQVPPHPEVVEWVLKRLDNEEGAEMNGRFDEGMRLGIMWATGQIGGDPIS